MRNRLRTRGDDSGVTLLIALVIITTVALVTGAILSHAHTNLRATVSLRGVAGTSYAADTAAKIAINNLVLGRSAPEWTTPGFNGTWTANSPWWVFTNNADGTGCFGATGTTARTSLVMSNLYRRAGNQTADSSARVECTPVPGTGLLSSSGGVVIGDEDETDPFGQALTTVGTGADPHEGIYLDVKGDGNTNAAPIGGGVASKTDLTVDHGDVTTDGYVRAASCAGSGQIISPDKDCSYSVATPAAPASPLGSVPSLVDPATVVNCRFTAGYYNSGQALSDATRPSTCPIAYFASGAYYFNFADDVPWTIDTKVIGGETTSTTAIPGACRSPIKFPSTDGVQFVFGGDSTISVENGAEVELCGKANAGEPPLTIYQQQTGSAPTATSVGPLAATTVDSPTGGKVDQFTATSGTLAGSVAATDTLGAVWKSTKKDNTGQLNLSGFPGMAAIPANASITSATVNVTYKAGAAPPPTATPVVGVADVAATSPITGGNADVTVQMQALIAAGAFNNTNKPTIQIKVPGSAKDNTFTIDKVSLSLVWETATLEPTTDTTFISTKTNSPARFVVHGGTYAPDGYINMQPGNATTALVAFRWGLIAQGVYFNVQPQQLFGYPLVSIPSPGRGLGATVVVVDLKVYVCVEASACATGSGVHALTARVMITDPPWTTHPLEGKRKIEVLSWAEQH